jgi:hypothetical protein
MSFRPAADLAGGRSLRWQALEGGGLEHLSLRATQDAILAEAVVIGERDGLRYGARYEIACAQDFTARSFSVTTTDGRRLAMSRDGDGWRDEARGRLPQFDACIDIDLSATPFTNTLPIRRCTWQNGQARRLPMLFVPFDSFQPYATEQIYTCLGPRLFRFETADGSFSADLRLDADGLVMDYPHLFQRL